MHRLSLAILLLLAACDGRSGEVSGSSVTIKLPPPQAAPAPGFSTTLTADIR